MKLNLNIAPLIAAGLFLFTAWEVQQSYQDEFHLEENNGVAISAAGPVERPVQASNTDFPATVGLGGGSADSLPAFWGCEGKGCGALQQYRKNGVRSWIITALHPTNTGSLRWILEQIQADSLMTNKPLDIITSPNLAGQYEWSNPADDFRGVRGVLIDMSSAPGHFIIGRWAAFQMKNVEDVVIRGLSHHGVRGEVVSYAFRFINSRRIVIDQVSISHTPQRGVQFYSDTTSFTHGRYLGDDCMAWASFSNTWVGYKTRYRGTVDEQLSDSPTMFMFSGLPRDGACTNHVSMSHSQINGAAGTDGTYRMPNASASYFHMVQNFIYNGGGNPWAQFNQGYIADVTHNYWLAGPYTTTNPNNQDYYPISVDTLWSCHADANEPPTQCAIDPVAALERKSLYVSTNHYSQTGGSSWADTAWSQSRIWDGPNQYIMKRFYPGTPGDEEHRRYTPMTYEAPFGIPLFEMNEANFLAMLDSIGNARHIDSLGNVYIRDDTITARGKQAARDTSIYKQPGDLHRDSFRVFFYPDFSVTTHASCRNEDGDAMCDAWEDVVADTSLQDTAIQASGYSALELFLIGGIVNKDTVFSGGEYVPPTDPGTVAAFPGAVGKAATANQTARDSSVNGSWDVKVFKIKNLDDTGQGSFRAILEDSIVAGAYNIVIPDTFGVINCTGGRIDVKDIGFAGATGANWWGRAGGWGLYVAGQAGPGGGLALDGCTLKLAENTTDAVFRYFRFQDTDGGSSNVSFEGGERIYFDHTTNRWAEYLNFNISADTAGTAGCPAKDCPLDGLTIANSMIYDSDSASSAICTITGGDPEHNTPLHNLLHYQNYYTNCTHRTPAVGGDSIWIANGIWFNVRRESGHFAEDATLDYLGNYSKRGVWTETSDGSSGSWMLPFEHDLPLGTISVYAGANRHWRNNMNWTTPPDSAWRGSKRIIAYYATIDTVTEGDSLPLSLKRNVKLAQDYFVFDQHEPNDLWRDSLMAIVGVSRKVDSLGNWTYVTSTGAKVRDSYDSIRAKQFADSVSFNLGDGFGTDSLTKPTIAAGAPIGDTDNDGLPNAYEKRVRGASDSTSLKPDSLTYSGYLVIELYLDGKLPDWESTDPVPAPAGTQTYVNVYNDSVRVRYLKGTDSVPYFAAPDTYPVPLYPDSVPNDATRDLFSIFNTPKPTTGLLMFTCDPTASGGAIIDSFTFRDSATALGLSPDQLLTIRMPGCE